MPSARYPASHVFYRSLVKDHPRIVHGQGCWLTDDEGRRYLDACAGAYVACLGHGVKEVVDAVTDQIRRVAYVSGMSFTNDAAEALADELAARALGDLDRFYFLSSGSDAVEAALKLARQYWVEAGRPDKSVLLALAPGYHGNTLLALSVSAREHYRRLFAPWLVAVEHVPAPLAYRCPCRGLDAGCARCTGRAVEAAILRIGPERVAAFIAEPVGGSSTGAAVPRGEYWRTVREICTRHEVIWIADEVLTGVGRTGSWSALEPYGAVPDLQVLGKGISGGYAPLAAVAAPRRLLDRIALASGGLLHAQTFSHTPMMCAAGVAAIRYLGAHDLVARSRRMGCVLHERLQVLRAHPHVGDIRGRGLLAGIELVEDQDTRRPFPRKAKVAERLTAAAQRAGLMVWPNVGHADGTDGDIVMIAPPFIITEEEIDEITTRLSAALEELS
jgi:adenosylmethionine-8-amino-7-oxononanoate aminotransferase